MITRRDIKHWKRALILAAALFIIVWGCAPKVKIKAPPVPEPVVSGEEIFTQGEHLFGTQAYEAALTQFHAYLDQFPDGPLADAALMKIAAIGKAVKDYASARAAYGEIIDRIPDSTFLTEARVGIAHTFFLEGQYENAAAAFAGIDLSILPLIPAKEALLMMGDTYWITGSTAEAAAAYAGAFTRATPAEQELIRSKINESLRLLSPSEITSLVSGLQSSPAGELIKTLAGPFVYHRFSLGCLLPLSGRFAGYGKRALKGVELALSRVAAMPDPPDYRIVFKDTGGDPEKAARAVKELVEEHHVAGVIGSIITAETAALEAQQAGIPIITMTQKEQIAQIGDYVFRNFFTPEMQVKALVSYCTHTLGVERFAILYPNEPYGSKFMNLFWDQVIQAGGIVTGVESYDRSLTDFENPIKKLVGLYYEVPEDLKTRPDLFAGDSLSFGTGLTRPLSDPLSGPFGISSGQGTSEAGMEEPEEPEAIVDFGAIFIPDSPKKAGLIIPQLAYHDVKDVYLLGTNLWYSTDLIDMAQQYSQGAVIPVGFFDGGVDNKVSRFTRLFEEAYGEKPGFVEAVAYDTTMLLLSAIKNPLTTTRDALRDALLSGGVYDGLTGPTIFDTDGDATKPMRLLRIKGETFIELKTETPHTVKEPS